MDELVIKVPSPFSGVDDVGFSARYPAQAWNERLRDVPFIVEGPRGRCDAWSSGSACSPPRTR